MVADALSRLPKQGDIVDDVDAVLPFVPVIQAKQAKDRDLRQKIKTNPSYFQKTVVEQVKVVTYKDRIYVPKDLRTRIMKWYRHYLCHPGEARMHKP